MSVLEVADGFAAPIQECADDITSAEARAKGSTLATAMKRVAVVTMVAIAVGFPAGQSTQVDCVCTEAHTCRGRVGDGW